VTRVNKCSSCGQSIPGKSELSFDFNRVKLRGRTYHIGPSPVAALTILDKAYPKTVTHEKIGTGVWGQTRDGLPLSWLVMLSMYIRVIRRTLQDHIVIHTIWGYGYRLEYIEGPSIPDQGINTNMQRLPSVQKSVKLDVLTAK